MTEISTKVRMTALAVLFAFCTMMMASTGAMAAPSAPMQKSAFVQGTSAAGDVLNGVFTITNFVNQGGQLVANGVLNGTLTRAAGVVTPVSNLAVTLPVSSVSASCPILNLMLGPLARPECFGSDGSLESSGAEHHGCSGGWQSVGQTAVRRSELTQRQQFERCIKHFGRWPELNSRRTIEA